jgi:hypothetical protein
MALARKAMTLLDELTVELPDNHVLLDDIYFHLLSSRASGRLPR